jgi:hypothetical protein
MRAHRPDAFARLAALAPMAAALVPAMMAGACTYDALGRAIHPIAVPADDAGLSRAVGEPIALHQLHQCARTQERWDTMMTHMKRVSCVSNEADFGLALRALQGLISIGVPMGTNA